MENRETEDKEFEKENEAAEIADKKSKDKEDQEIVNKFLDRSESAIEFAYRKYGGLCYTVSNNILNSAEDSKECVNDTMLRAWNTIPPQKPNSLSAYLAKIARNLALDRYRFYHRKKRDCFSEVLEEAEDVFISDDMVERETDKKELMNAVNSFLEKLSDKKRRIFLGRYWFCESVGDLAKRYGSSENVISVNLSRTRRALKEYLKKEGFDIE
ncbi:MAG: sigma-70 family RNA polymerase sigma factor [Ruminococcaceae bacterium]|nr:sigma-70 family RNA polymerase sigma factor [Oscillospiraceae bacterium]